MSNILPNEIRMPTNPTLSHLDNIKDDGGVQNRLTRLLRSPAYNREQMDGTGAAFARANKIDAIVAARDAKLAMTTDPAEMAAIYEAAAKEVDPI